MILTAHVTHDLITQLVLPVPAQLEVALESLHVGLQLDGEAEVLLPSILVALLVPVSALPARIAAPSERFGVRSIDIFVFRAERLVKVIIGFTIGQGRRAVSSRPGTIMTAGLDWV